MLKPAPKFEIRLEWVLFGGGLQGDESNQVFAIPCSDHLIRSRWLTSYHIGSSLQIQSCWTLPVDGKTSWTNWWVVVAYLLTSCFSTSFHGAPPDFRTSWGIHTDSCRFTAGPSNSSSKAIKSFKLIKLELDGEFPSKVEPQPKNNHQFSILIHLTKQNTLLKGSDKMVKTSCRVSVQNLRNLAPSTGLEDQPLGWNYDSYPKPRPYKDSTPWKISRISDLAFFNHHPWSLAARNQ